MSYEGHCGKCDYFKGPRRLTEPFDTYYASIEKGYCEWYRCYYWADDTCSHQKERGSSSSCYITTVVCKILGFADDCGMLRNLRDFRDNILQKNEQYVPLLFEYDTVGPQIAECLEKDYQETNGDSELATNLFNFYIQPTASLIEQGNYDEAVSRYQEMTKGLEEYYGIQVPTEVSLDYDFQAGGHGVLKLKKETL